MTERAEAARYRKLHQRIDRMARDLDRESAGLRTILQTEHDPHMEGIYYGRLWTVELHAKILRAILSDVYTRQTPEPDYSPDPQDYYSREDWENAMADWKVRNPNG